MKKILLIVGTRPNYMKISQFKKLSAQYKNCEVRILHTGQHYDAALAQVFFDELEIKPDDVLSLSKDSSVKQMAEIMMGVEKYIQTKFQPDVVLVPGDVNSSVAAAIAANKLNIPVGHIESGLRSNDLSMPEEHNRKMIDEIASYLFVTEPSGEENLKAEKKTGQIHYVGNTMIDTIVAFQAKIQQSMVLKDLQLSPQNYALVTLHRPSNVDTREGLFNAVEVLKSTAEKIKVVWSVHPRTRQKLQEFDLLDSLKETNNLIISPPQPYFSFQRLISQAKFVLTDSGGIQEETTYYRVPCLTLRENTERPVTIDQGSNVLVGTHLTSAKEAIKKVLNGAEKSGTIPRGWDGEASKRILAVLMNG